jgi:adenylate kinase family enzyme
MPKVDDTPKTLKPYRFHGIDVTNISSDEAVSDCPFCGRENKFSINVESGLWRCLVCNEGSQSQGKAYAGGNAYTFLRKLWDISYTSTSKYSELAGNRRLLMPETLAAWNVAQSTIGYRNWVVPAYGADGKLNNLYRYVKDLASGKYRLMCTAEIPHALFGVNLLKKSCRTIYLCEGPWDAMVLWEVLRSAKPDGNEYLRTANEEVSLLANASVIATPGCNVFDDKWIALFSGKKVVICFDNDHPKEHPTTKNLLPPAGYSGAKRIAQVLSRAEEPPLEIHYLAWGGKDKDHDSNLTSGYDLRDFFSEEDTMEGRIRILPQILDRMIPIPSDWVGGRTAEAKKTGGTDIDCKQCESWKELQKAWRKAMKWTEGLDRALSVMLASVVSTKAAGDQLWVEIIGPPACGKSTLCEALSVNKRFIVAKSTIRGFHSGYQTDKDGSEDNSLMASIQDKTLVTKDGDTLLQSPNLGQILSEARDVYDGTSRTHYRNKMGKDYNNFRLTWILCGTSSLLSLDQSELGERFVKCIIMDRIDDDMEDEILIRVANKADRVLSIEADGTMESQHDPEMVNAMRLSGGYVAYLRTNARDLLSECRIPEALLKGCIHLGKFVAYMRARPSTKQDENVEREFAARLVSQFTRLAKCMAVVLNKKEVDQEVMRRVTKVALDTARGRTLEIAKHLYDSGETGLLLTNLAAFMNDTDAKIRGLLKFLIQISAVETYRKSTVAGVQTKPIYRLTPRMMRLYEEVMRTAATEEE